jgi:hypothetical protein
MQVGDSFPAFMLVTNNNVSLPVPSIIFDAQLRSSPSCPARNLLHLHQALSTTGRAAVFKWDVALLKAGSCDLTFDMRSNLRSNSELSQTLHVNIQERGGKLKLYEVIVQAIITGLAAVLAVFVGWLLRGLRES